MKKGFTLAEVLITLGIIGIVAAMTIPTLVQNYQDRVTVTKLRKTKAVTEQMFKMMMVTDGVDKLSKTSAMELWGGYYCHPASSGPSCRALYNAFKNYAKFEIDTNYSKYSYLNIPNSATRDLYGSLILPDGVMLSHLYVSSLATSKTAAVCNEIKKLGGSICSDAGEVYIDVNGASGPNVLGRDIFYYYISDEGRLYAKYGKDYALYSNRTPLATNTSYWRNNPYDCGTPGKKDTVEKGASGWGCAARIEENDWKIDY